MKLTRLRKLLKVTRFNRPFLVVEAGPIAVERGLPHCAACQSCRELQGHRHIQNAAVSESPTLL